MPGPRPLFQPLSRDIAGAGPAPLPDFGSAFEDESSLLTIESMQAEEDDKAWWVRGLEFIEGITFGQSVKGLLAGTGEEGIGDNLEEFFLKNPLFQITDAIGLTDNVTGPRVEFTDVRTNLFGEDPALVNEGFGNFMINLVGSVLTDPGSFLMPLGLTKTGVAAASNAAKVGAQVGRAASPAALRTASLVKSVENGYRAAAVFKLWGVPGRLVIPTPKSMDLALAHTLEGIGNLLHTNGVTGPILSRFSVGAVKLGTDRGILGTERAAGGFSASDIFHGKDLVLTGSEARKAFRLSLKAGNEKMREVFADIMPGLMQVMRQSPEILTDPSVGRTLTRFVETGLGRGSLLDEAGEVLKGVDLIDNQAQIVDWVTTEAFNHRAVIRAEKEATARGISDTYKSASIGDNEAINKILGDHADLALPARTMEIQGFDLRPGVDIQDFDVIRRDRNIEGLLESPSTAGPARGLVTDPKTGEAVEATGIQGRADVERSLSPEIREAGAQEVALDAADDFKHAIDEAKDPNDLLDRLLGASDDIRGVLDKMGEAENAAGLLNDLMAGYFPRNLTEGMGRLLNDRFKAFVGQRGSAAIDATANFMKHRQFTELSIFDVNWIGRELGLKFMGRAPIKGFDKSARTGAQQVMADIYNPPFIRGFKEKFWKSKGEEAKAYEEMIQVFETNPMLATYQRMEESMKALSTHAVTSELLAADSVFIDLTEKFGSLARIAEIQDTGKYVGMMADKAGRWGLKTPGSVFRAVMKSDDTSAAFIARNRMSAEVRDNLGKDITHYDRTVNLLKNAGDTPLDASEFLLKIGTHDPSDVRKLKTQIGAYQKLKAESKNFTGEALEKATRQLDHLREHTIQPLRSAARDVSNALAAMKKDLHNAVAEKAGNRAVFGKREKFISKLTQGQRSELSELKRTLNEATNSSAMDQRLKIMLGQKERGFSTVDELQELSPKMRAKMDNETIHFMRKETFNAIWGVDGNGGAMAMIKSPDKMGHTMRHFDKWQRWWKGWTVVPWAQSRFRDQVTNMALLAQGGIGPVKMLGAMKDSWRITNAYRKVIAGDPEASAKMAGQFINLGGDKKISMAQVMRDVQTRIGMGSSYVRDEMQFAAGQAMESFSKKQGLAANPRDFVKRMTKIGPKGMTGNPLFRAGYTVTEYGDSMPKIMGYIAELKSGKSAAEAAANVRAWTYSPDNMLTAFERHKVARLVPFYRWMKFAISTEVGAAMSRPGTVSVFQKVYENAHKAVGVDSSDLDVVRPEWLADKMGIPFRKSKKGIDFFVAGSFVPFGEVVELTNTIGKILDPEDENSTLKYLGNRMTPPLKLLVEQFRNESLFTERPLENTPGETTEFLGIRMRRKMVNVFRSIRLLTEIDKLKIFTPQEMDGMVKASSSKRVDRPLSQRLLESGFFVVPKTAGIDVERQARFTEVQLSKKGARRKALLKKGRREGAPADEMEELIGQLAQVEAEKRKLLRVRRSVRRQ